MSDDAIFPFEISPSTPFLELRHGEHGESWVEFDLMHASLEEVPRVRIKFFRCLGVRSDWVAFEGASGIGIVKDSNWLRGLRDWQQRHYPGSLDTLAGITHYFFAGHDIRVEVLATGHAWSYVRRPPDPGKDARLWNHVLSSEREFGYASAYFLGQAKDVRTILRTGIDRVGERNAVMKLLPGPGLDSDIRRELIPKVLTLASWPHGQIGFARDCLLSLPRHEVIGAAWRHIDELFHEATDDEYRYLGRLFQELDHALVAEVIRRGESSDDPDIREVIEELRGEPKA